MRPGGAYTQTELTRTADERDSTIRAGDSERTEQTRDVPRSAPPRWMDRQHRLADIETVERARASQHLEQHAAEARRANARYCGASAAMRPVSSSAT